MHAWVQIYVVGGYDSNFDTVRTIEVFDPATNQWSTLPAQLNSGR